MDLAQMEQRIIENDKKSMDNEKEIAVLKAQFSAHSDYTKIASDKAEVLMNARLEGMNEVRSQLKDQNSTFMPRTEYDANHQNLITKIESLQKIVYIGMGMLLIIQVVVQVAMHFIP